MDSSISIYKNIPAMSLENIEKVSSLENEALKLEQIDIETSHTFHAGMYARTVKIPAGTTITGALIKIPTILIISGNAVMFVDGEAKKVIGYHVYSASENRKQVFVAIEDSFLTMIFTTKSTSIESAEQEFTDEFNMLLTNRRKDQCQE